MRKIQQKSVRAIIILLMLGTSPISVTYSFADLDSNQDKKEQNYSKIQEYPEEGLDAILTEEIVNGKLEVRHYELPDDMSEEDMKRRVSFDDQSSGWVYVKTKAYHSGIILFDGKASKVGDSLWKISTTEKIDLREKWMNFGSNERTDESGLLMDKTADEELDYRVVFSGKITETDDQNVFAIYFMFSGIKNTEMTQNIKIPQFGELGTNSEKLIVPIKNSEIKYR